MALDIFIFFYKLRLVTINNETSVKVKRTKYRTHKVSIAKCVYIAENAIVVSETSLADFEIA